MSSAMEELSRHLNVAVAALHTLAPERLERLGAEHPLYADLLKPKGAVLSCGAGTGTGERRLAAQTWGDALDAAVKKVNAQVVHALAMLQLAGRLELATSIGAAASGSTLIGMLSGGAGTARAHIAIAVIGLACSIVTTVIAFLRQAPLGARRIDACREAKKLTAEAAVVALHLHEVANDTAPNDALISQTDDLLKKLLAIDL